MWRYWRDLPPEGEIGVIFGSWYNDPVKAFVLGQMDEVTFERELEAINRFELMLAEEGALILKLWFYLARDVQKKRLKKVKDDPLARRHVLEEWSGADHHKEMTRAGEMVARRSSAGFAPWVVIPSGDDRYRDMAMGRTIEQATAMARRRRWPRPRSSRRRAAGPRWMASTSRSRWPRPSTTRSCGPGRIGSRR